MTDTRGAQLAVMAESWPIAGVFTISRGSKTQADVVVAQVTRDGVTGCAECVPYPHYGETVQAVVDALELMKEQVADGLTREALLLAMAPGAARNVLDCALWDLEAKSTGTPVWRLAGLSSPPGSLETAETISLGTPEAMGDKARTLHTRPLLKVKVGGEGVLERLGAIRKAAPDCRMIVDANEGWTIKQLREWLPDLAGLKVDLIEQPLPAGQDGPLSDLINSPVPLCADESVHSTEDLETLVGKYSYINIKLDKTGGLTEALRLKARGRELGLGVMVGCMVGTSLAMAPAVLVAQGAEFVDLDGPLMLKEDRDGGLSFDNGILYPPSAALWG